MNGMIIPDDGFKGQPPLSQYNMKMKDKDNSFETYSRSSMMFNSAGKAGTTAHQSYDDL